MSKKIETFRELDVYKNAMKVAMKIFEMTKIFPREEKYSLTDQIRRSSRSVCANIAEAWRKRRYEKAFLAKINDSEAEASETRVWLDFSLRCQYIDLKKFENMDDQYDHILRQLSKMIKEPEKWILRKK